MRPSLNGRQIVATLSTALFTVALLVFAPLDEWGPVLRQARLRPLVVVVLTVLLAGLAEAMRFRVLTRPADLDALRTLRMVYVATCVGHLPFGVIGSDVYRTGGLRALGVTGPAAVIAVAAARGLGLISVVAVTACGLAALPTEQSDAVRLPPSIAVAGGLLVLGVVVAGCLRGLRWLAQRSWVPSTARELARAIGRLGPRSVAAGVGWSVVVTGLRVAVVAGCAWALLGDPQLPASIVAAGVGMVASVIPSAMAGVGPQEAGLASVLAGFGIGPAEAVIIAVAARAATVVGALAGAAAGTLWAWLWRRDGREYAGAPDEA